MGLNIFKRAQPTPVAAPAVTPASEFQRLRKQWSSFPRYKEAQLEFLSYKITAVDCASFLAQLNEIFVDEQYQFRPARKSPVIIDCGANIGMSCIYFKRTYPDSKVIAIEADERICRVLAENLSSNGMADVEVQHKAVWTDEEGVSFSSDGADGGSIMGGNEKALVPSIRLRDLLQSYEAIDLLKIDIEGAEHAVLMDSSDQLAKIDHLFFEYHSWNTEVQRLDELLHLLSKSGFRYHVTHIMPHRSPFIHRGEGDAMDLQLNIFAYRAK